MAISFGGSVILGLLHPSLSQPRSRIDSDQYLPPCSMVAGLRYHTADRHPCGPGREKALRGCSAVRRKCNLLNAARATWFPTTYVHMFLRPIELFSDPYRSSLFTSRLHLQQLLVARKEGLSSLWTLGSLCHSLTFTPNPSPPSL